MVYQLSRLQEINEETNGPVFSTQTQSNRLAMILYVPAIYTNNKTHSGHTNLGSQCLFRTHTSHGVISTEIWREDSVQTAIQDIL